MENNEKIAHLTTLSINLFSKAMIALVLLNEKPAVVLDIYSHNAPANVVEETLKLIGLSVIPIIREKTINTSENYIATFSIAVDEITARILAMIESEKDYRITDISIQTHLYHKLYGVLMGQPLSSIDAFTRKYEGKNMLSCDDARYEEIMKINHLNDYFGFSKNFCEEEAKFFSGWHAVLKQHAPQILKEYEDRYFR